jgi:hypothetical protein
MIWRNNNMINEIKKLVEEKLAFLEAAELAYDESMSIPDVSDIDLDQFMSEDSINEAWEFTADHDEVPDREDVLDTRTAFNKDTEDYFKPNADSNSLLDTKLTDDISIPTTNITSDIYNTPISSIQSEPIRDSIPDTTPIVDRVSDIEDALITREIRNDLLDSRIGDTTPLVTDTYRTNECDDTGGFETTESTYEESEFLGTLLSEAISMGDDKATDDKAAADTPAPATDDVTSAVMDKVGESESDTTDGIAPVGGEGRDKLLDRLDKLQKSILDTKDAVKKAFDSTSAAV